MAVTTELTCHLTIQSAEFLTFFEALSLPQYSIAMMGLGNRKPFFAKSISMLIHLLYETYIPASIRTTPQGVILPLIACASSLSELA